MQKYSQFNNALHYMTLKFRTSHIWEIGIVEIGVKDSSIKKELL
jgi:hypothetical protein